MSKICLGCDQEIPDSRRSNAKYCTDSCGNNARLRKWCRNNPAKVMSKRVAENSDTASRILIRIKSRAKKYGIAFDLIPEDIVVPHQCPVLGMTLATNNGRGYHPNSPSLDRIKPALGYVRGNVRVISSRANLLKNDASVDELRRVLADLEVLEAAHG